MTVALPVCWLTEVTTLVVLVAAVTEIEQVAVLSDALTPVTNVIDDVFIVRPDMYEID